MRRSVLVVLVAVPLALVGLWLLMSQGYLGLTAALVGVGVVALLGVAVWQWRLGFRRWAALLTVVAVALAGTVTAYAWTLNDALGDIDRVDASALGEGERPARSRVTKALNILLMGADDPTQLIEKPSVAELLEDGKWNPGSYRSDTVMVVHVRADRRAAYVVSVPRDSYVTIYDGEGEAHGKQRLNVAFAEYGPFGTWRTVENLSGLRLDHMAIIDFDGFRDLTTAIGGVDVYIPEDVYDSAQDQQWTKGWTHLEGSLALRYVRTRHGLSEGDFDRVDRQQNFLRAVLRKVLADETVGNPAAFPDTLRAITRNLTVDEDWSTGAIRSLAFGLRSLDSERVRFMTLPLDHYETVEGVGSVNIIDQRRARALWRAVSDDRVGSYLRRNPDDELPDDRDVS